MARAKKLLKACIACVILCLAFPNQESRKITGLYFAGEVLDIDGPTGCYNLSIAFATARLAVESICFDAKIRL
ncbi:MAG: NAD(P)/FAD-dependent oxidoreductase [Kiritimatiellae bacterium]|nr:NAD(P)/FAD-dependent oxidoreductase [Kiritimatiellia bacterium]